MRIRRDPSFTLHVRQWPTTAVVRVGGVLDLATVPLLRAVLHELLDDVAVVLVDLAEVTLLDGQGVGLLVSTHRHAVKRGAALWCRGPTGRVLRALEVTGAAKLCDPPALDLPDGDGTDRTVETLLRAGRRHAVGDADRDELRRLAILSRYDLAVTLARGYRGRGEAAEDLLQVAMVGLIKAIDGFDADRGAGFTAYAIPTITGEIKRHFRDRGWMIRVPRRLQEIGIGVPRAREVLAQRLGRAPTVSELAEQLDVDDEDVLDALEAAQVYRPGSLSAPAGRSDDDTAPLLGEVIGAPDSGFDLVDDRESLRGLLNQLPPREQRIIALRFYGNLTQSQIAEQVGLSQMHVSRLLAEALGRLRAGLLAGS